eukprot:TRINITY_DN6230_c0_g1_i1.p1 TRINITY_DN6230_c0_g1~~TRINITY_DN6230_c0_g1_i1.p1  ORF type:complete len:283 (+),score=35.94 TRINITY_DN6230_c0_g1_i1:35-883(+)
MENAIRLICGLSAALLAVYVDRQINPVPIQPASTVPSMPSYDIAWQDKISPSDDPNLPAYGLMRMEWQTPIYRVNLKSFHKDANGILNRVAGIVEQHFDELATRNPSLNKQSWQRQSINQMFFEWQTKGGWAALRRSEDVQLLEGWMNYVTDIFLAQIGQSEDQVKARNRSLHAWATVHEDCTSHLLHTHPNHQVSGVVYIAMPEDAGPIQFYDPRGPRPPFDGVVTIQPAAGDVVLFPSWLAHQVMPTPGSHRRISIAFNTAGDWDDTASISASFPLQRDD